MNVRDSLAALNTPAVANAGAALVATSATALGAVVLALANDQPVHVLAIVMPFVGLVVGGALAYLGKPSTLPHP